MSGLICFLFCFCFVCCCCCCFFFWGGCFCFVCLIVCCCFGGWGVVICSLLLFLLLVVLLMLFLILILILMRAISAISRQDWITGIASADKGRALDVVAGVVLFCLRGAGGCGSKHTTIIQVNKLFSLTLPKRSLVSSVIAPQSVSLSVIPRSYRDIKYRENAVYPQHEHVTIYTLFPWRRTHTT